MDQVTNVSLKNLRFESASAVPNEYKAVFDSLDSTYTNLTIDSCWFSSLSNCNNISLTLDNTVLLSKNITVTNCTFETCGRINIEIFTNKNRIMIEGLTIANNRFSTNGMMCLSMVTPTRNMTIRQNEIACNCPNTYAIGFESTPWMINAIFDRNTLSGNFGTGAISNINVVGTDIKAFGEPCPFSYQITNNVFSDVKATDSALFLKGLGIPFRSRALLN
jgi:hypothetical protein